MMQKWLWQKKYITKQFDNFLYRALRYVEDSVHLKKSQALEVGEKLLEVGGSVSEQGSMNLHKKVTAEFDSFIFSWLLF